MHRRQFVSSILSLAGGALVPGRLLGQSIPSRGQYDFRFTRLMYESGDWNVDERMPK